MNFRYIFSLISTFLGRFKGIILIGILSGILVFIGIRILSPLVFSKKTEKIGVVGRYRLDNLPDSILGYASEGLTNVKSDGSSSPGMASSWEAKDDGKTWVFHIDTNKTWQDGKKISSEDIQLSFSDVSVEKPDSKTIVFKLQSPFAPFPEIVSKPIFKKGFLGDGSWEVKKITVSGSNVEKVYLNDKKGNKKTFNFYPTEERAKLALKLGLVSSLINIFNADPFPTWSTMNVVKNVDYGKYVAVFFNTSKDKIAADKSLRQALSYAINKNVFDAPRAISPISPDSWAFNSQVKPYNYDPDRAKELIKALPDEEQKNLSINLTTTSVLLGQAEKIAKDWQAVGVKVNVQVASGVPDQFDALLAIFDIPQDPDQYLLWHSNQDATNISKYTNPRIDKLLEDGRTTIDQEGRKKIYLDFQRFLVEDSPAIFLYYPNTFTISKK